MSCEIAIAALDLTTSRLEFLNALLNTIKLQAKLTTTIVGDPDRLPKAIPQAAICAPEEILGFDMPWDLPPWCHEQLLALAFAAGARSQFSLVLPLGSFILRPLAEETLLPHTLARTYWEQTNLHPDWWKTAADLTRRRRFSPWEGPSILPALLSRELARWTLDIVRRENGADAFSVLLDAARNGRYWSAMALYATASGSRFTKFHHDPFDSKTYPLMTRSLIWNQDLGLSFGRDDGLGPDLGLMTFTDISSITDAGPILDRLYGRMVLNFPVVGSDSGKASSSQTLGSVPTTAG